MYMHTYYICRAGGVGLNLIAASVVILLDPWYTLPACTQYLYIHLCTSLTHMHTHIYIYRWNPSTEDQAIDRVHRLGQVRSVGVYRLLVRDTVEERLLALQVRYV